MNADCTDSRRKSSEPHKFPKRLSTSTSPLLLCFTMKNSFAVILAVTCLASACVPQTEKWIREDKTDPLRGTNYSLFYIEGKFLTTPQKATDDMPRFFAKCVPGSQASQWRLHQWQAAGRLCGRPLPGGPARKWHRCALPARRRQNAQRNLGHQ